jgi:sugar/nucleoside kinase (ribokinase family)
MPPLAEPILVSGCLCLELSVTRPRTRDNGPQERTYWQHGGNGGHMAVAAARLGAPVALCAHAGLTSHDEDIVATLAGEGVNVAGIVRRGVQRSPAYLRTDRPRDNQPVTVSSSVAPALDADDVDHIDNLMLDHAWLLADAALPLGFLEELIARAGLYGLHIVLCMTRAALDTIPRRVWEQVDFLVTNVSTVELLGRHGLWPAEARDNPAIICHGMPALRGAVVLYGAEELRWADRSSPHCLPIGAQQIVHVRGAGAGAAAALTVALAEQSTLTEAARFAHEAVRFYVRHEGTRAAMPLRRELSVHD